MTEVDRLKLYVIRYRWAFEELVVDQKYTEINWRDRKCWKDKATPLEIQAQAEIREMVKSANDMYRYLLASYGSLSEVLKMLKYVIYTQRIRRKSCWLES